MRFSFYSHDKQARSAVRPDFKVAALQPLKLVELLTKIIMRRAVQALFDVHMKTDALALLFSITITSRSAV